MDGTLIVGVWVICTVGAFLIANAKGAKDAVMWGIVGLLLGPIGVLLALIFAKPARGPA